MKEFNLKIGGIYTDKDDWLDIIIEENEDYYFLISISNEKLKLNTNQTVNTYLKENNVMSLCFTEKATSDTLREINGYLGQLDKKMLKYYISELHLCDWYKERIKNS